MKSRLIILIVILFISCKKEELIYKNTKSNQSNLGLINYQNWETININNVEWMKYNLCITKYNDGTPIKHISNINNAEQLNNSIYYNDWENSNVGAYTYYDNNINIANTYGLLYNGLTIKSGKLIPDGWRLPTENDFKELCLYLDSLNRMPQHQMHANSIKALYGWETPIYATNETWFNALGAGYISSTGFPMLLNKYTAYWVQPENNKLKYVSLQNVTNQGTIDNYIYYHCYPIDFNDINRNFNYGFSIRLIKIKEQNK